MTARILFFLAFLGSSLHAAPPTVGQWELRKKESGGMVSHGITWADGQVIVLDTGVPEAITLDKVAVGLNNVENIAISTYVGSTNWTTVGTITTGTWNATAIALGKIAQGGATSGQALTWNGSAWAPTTIAAGITIGSTAISGGTSGRLLTSGSVVGELTLGSGVETLLGSFTTTNANAALSGDDFAFLGVANTFLDSQVITDGDGDPFRVQNGGSDRFKVSTTATAGGFWVGHASYHAYEAGGNTWVYSYAGGERCRLVFGQNAYSILVKTTGGAGTGLLVADNSYYNSYIGGMLLDNTTVRTFLIEPIGRDVMGGYTGPGHTMRIKGGDGQTASAGAAGGEMQISGGAAGGSGNNNGGDVHLIGGAATGSGAKGGIYLDLDSLPTTDPGVSGRLWRDGDTVKISHP